MRKKRFHLRNDEDELDRNELTIFTTIRLNSFLGTLKPCFLGE